MRKKGILSGAVLFVLLASAVSFAEDHAKPMTNDDVVAMVKAGLPEATIISAIHAQATNFDVSAASLISLKNQNVSSKVMDAMLEASSKHQDSAPPAAPGATPPQTANGSAAASPSSANPASPASGDGAPKHSTSFFDRLGQIQNQVTGAVQQTEGTAQQMRGTAQQLHGSTQPGQPAASTAPTLPAAPAATPAATNTPAQTAAQNQAASQAALQQQRQQQLAARQAAYQQQRQQQLAARQQRVARLTACRDQALKAQKSGDANYQKNLTACVQTAMQAK